MLNSRGFRFAAVSFLVACGASPSPHVEAVPEQSIFDDADKPSIYDAGPPPIVDAAVPIVVEEDDDDAGDTSAPAAADDAIRPLAITPSVPESAVRIGLDIFVADDGAPFIAAIDKRVAPGRVANSPFATELRTPLEKDAFAYRLLNFRMESNVSVHTLRHGKRAAGIALTMSGDNRPILPVDWLRAVVAFKGVDEKASRPWYVGMSQRMSVAGRSSGLAIFDNGTAVGVLMEAQYEVGGEDLTVKARTEFFPAGGFDASAWGVVLNDVKGVATKNGDGHAGIDTRDLLSQALHVTLPVHP